MDGEERHLKRQGHERLHQSGGNAQSKIRLNLFYVNHSAIATGQTQLGPEESSHAIKVLRLKAGDPVVVIDGTGTYYDCTISETRGGVCHFSVTGKRFVPGDAYPIHIAIAPTKNHDRVEWFLEKAVEIGIAQISFMICARSERKLIKSDRLLKVAISAMKQAMTPWLPDIGAERRFSEVLTFKADQKFIAHLDDAHPEHLFDKAKKGHSSLILIGPEGDFTEQELAAAQEANFQKVALGSNRLRTETAALAALHTLTLLNRK